MSYVSFTAENRATYGIARHNGPHDVNVGTCIEVIAASTVTRNTTFLQNVGVYGTKRGRQRHRRWSRNCRYHGAVVVGPGSNPI